VARWGQFLLAMACFGLAISLMIRSGLGLGPWDAFHVGLARLTGLTIGQASIVAGVAVLLGSMAMGVRPGIGTIANMFLVGIAVDVMLPFVPAAESLGGGMVSQGAYFALGILGAGFGTGMYIAAALGAGPRDGLMVAVSARSGWPVRRVRTLLEASVLAAGWAMGGKLGVGTVAFVAGIGPVTQWGMQHFGLVGARGNATAATARLEALPADDPDDLDEPRAA
jgi:uncharacterized membrane protein YczE